MKRGMRIRAVKMTPIFYLIARLISSKPKEYHVTCLPLHLEVYYDVWLFSLPQISSLTPLLPHSLCFCHTDLFQALEQIKMLSY
jgi:hypothetical protein